MRGAIRISLVVVSVLLSVATVVSWGRSLVFTDRASRAWPTSVDGRYAREWWVVLSDAGRVTVTRSTVIPVDDAEAARLRSFDQTSRGLGWSYGPIARVPLSSQRLVAGVPGPSWRSGTERHPQMSIRFASAEVPHWLLLLVVSPPALIALVRFVRHVRSGRAARGAGFPVERAAADAHAARKTDVA